MTVTTNDPNTLGDDSRSSYHGYYSPTKRLIFVKLAAPSQMMKPLVHELGHHLDPALMQTLREEQETVAEATAFVVAAHEGLDTSSCSFPYIAFWSGRDNGPALVKQVIGRVGRHLPWLVSWLPAGVGTGRTATGCSVIPPTFFCSPKGKDSTAIPNTDWLFPRPEDVDPRLPHPLSVLAHVEVAPLVYAYTLGVDQALTAAGVPLHQELAVRVELLDAPV